MKQRIFTTIKEPSVIARVIKRTPFEALSSDGTLAAAVMVAAALCAVIVANTPLYASVHHAFTQSVGIWIANFYVSMTFEAFINDFLMAIFFLLVGIELKYEMVVGQLRRPRQALLPMLAAVGGVCVPALIYTAFNWGKSVHGWAIPIATDIAFALGVMSLLGKRVAPQTKVFFQTLAIADDLSLIHISEPTRRHHVSRMPSSA